ncbi:uncharacterized protein LOC106155156 [Lingula anatina]|uniref:Uncharacterized protein LOC106151316 n=1 Tax=Lingula anatina TaxID=7574 RepID=A0A1S3HGU3_LINAN|nr:uncharacterized protein LOC106151316 [Lingula anatina]XP_013379980.1 uncharacterized protein LOC106151316 [Lingula anatina]XP_013379981.1 uncharacterized protein LOC106151316 [Lingula anatina]XP_013385289.1 uncharacterized protein LOC106155156 [Lingula anatina]XP_013385290.1 uncharacterized protein LOC106155156 [Lingula anatina]XP_013385291.1 uncharacterized protein LOC106155156 [Lingula anatina]|eukprot:XP_013379979.1 uncharacterized protein LOC106151316 [Lingula anatina]
MVTMTDSVRNDGTQPLPPLSKLKLSLPYKALKAWLALAEQEHCKFVAADQEGHFAYQLYMNHVKQDLFHVELKFLKAPIIQLLEDSYEVAVNIEEVVDVAEEKEEKAQENCLQEEQKLHGAIPKLVKFDGKDREIATHSPPDISYTGGSNGQFSKEDWSLGQPVSLTIPPKLPVSTSVVPKREARLGQFRDYNNTWPQEDGPLDLSKPVKRKEERDASKVTVNHEMVETMLKPENLLKPENYPHMAALAYQQWALQAGNPLAFTFPNHVLNNMNNMNKPPGGRPRGRGRPPGKSSSNCRSVKHQLSESKEITSSLPRSADSAIVSSTQRQLGSSKNSLSPHQHGVTGQVSEVAGTSAIQRPQSPQLSQYMTYASFLQNTISSSSSSLDVPHVNSSTSCGTLDSASDDEITDRRTNRSFIHRPRDRGKAILRSRQIRHEMGCVMSYLKQLLPPEMRYGRTMFQATILELSTDYIAELQKQERENLRCLDIERQRHQRLLSQAQELKRALYGSNNSGEVGKELGENIKDMESN